MNNDTNSSLESDYLQFCNILRDATCDIHSDYINLPIDGYPIPIYRERVYCYELYHMLRNKMPSNWYSLGGEVDKRNHPNFTHLDLKNTKPDIVVHKPGNMNDNLVVIEVKPIYKLLNGNKQEIPNIKKDLKTLAAFLKHANYHKAIYLFYGSCSSSEHFDKIKTRASELAHTEESICLDNIDIYWHEYPGYKAEYYHW